MSCGQTGVGKMQRECWMIVERSRSFGGTSKLTSLSEKLARLRVVRRNCYEDLDAEARPLKVSSKRRKNSMST